jgi:hypothetical protein
MTKVFPADVVLSAYSGRFVCKDFGDVHELMDLFYPGIMTLGLAAMSTRAAAELRRQFPILGDVPAFREPWQEWKIAALAVLPPTFEVTGPHELPEGEIERAFDEMEELVKKADSPMGSIETVKP